MRATLTEDQIIAILEDSDNGLTQGKIAEKYGVTQSAISQLLSGKTWYNYTGIEIINGERKIRPNRNADDEFASHIPSHYNG